MLHSNKKMKIIEQNKKAHFDYFIDETIEAGIVLKSSEVKSLKMGNCAIKDSFCHAEKGEIFLKNFYIAPYKMSTAELDPRQNRKLLMHKREINRLIGKSKEKGYTLVPTKVYYSGNKIKIEVGLGKGKHAYDKKATLKEKDIQRDAEREISRYK